MRIFKSAPTTGRRGGRVARAFSHTLIGASLAIGIAGFVGGADAANLTVIVKQVQGDRGGFLEANLYTDPTTYRDILASGAGRGVYAARVPADGDTVEILIENVEPGTYAVGVYHDENDDGKLNTGFLPIPLEGVGAGNDAVGSFGPPSFEDSSIEIGDEDLTTTINLDY